MDIRNILENAGKIWHTLKQSYQLEYGIILSLVISVLALSGRLVDLPDHASTSDLVGSEVAILLLCLGTWIGVRHFLLSTKNWNKVVTVVAGVILNGVFSASFTYIFEDYPDENRLEVAQKVSLSMYRGVFISVAGFSAALYANKINRDQDFKMEHQRRENLWINLHHLTKEVNPHFLYNALSMLNSGLNDNWAKEFIRKLSLFYRHMSRYSNDMKPVAVKQEMEFARAYMLILNERYSHKLHLYETISEAAARRFVPHCSIQMLVENVVKHNLSSDSERIDIHVFDVNNMLVVKNSKPHGKIVIKSLQPHGLGLRNIELRYSLLTSEPVIIDENETHFIVKIPLLNDQNTDYRG